MNSDYGIPVPGEKYRHFKGGLYQIVTVAKHSESGELLVIYQALYGEFDCYARPLEMFAGNNEKGEKRFVRVDGDSTGKAFIRGESGIPDEYAGENGVLFMILDADTMKDKLALIKDNRKRLDKKILGNLAVAFDLVIDSDDIDDQFEQIVQYLETRARFETDRLR